MSARRMAWVAIVAILLVTVSGFAFGYGVLVGKYEVYPYTTVRTLYRRLPHLVKDRLMGVRDETGTELVDTNLQVFAKRVYEVGQALGLETSSGAGALAPLGDVLLGVDTRGAFFVYTGGGEARRLAIPFDANATALERFLEGQPHKDLVLSRFRVHDILASAEGDRTTIYLSHHQWNQADRCAEFRVSRLVVAASAATIVDGGDIPAGTWESLFVAEPCLDNVDAGFGGHMAGGRLVLANPGELLVTVGDHSYDGFNRDEAYSQRDDVSYGKLIRIDLASGDHETVAKGLRNPQGFMRDADGRLWTTEHGPKGGDELNLITEGGNYGWPIVSYGTHYGKYDWPLSNAQGRHENFVRPHFVWIPSIAVSNLIQVGAEPKRWAGDLLVSSLIDRSLQRLRFRDGRFIFAEPIDVGVRIRDIDQLGDGTIVLWTDRAAIVELLPIDQEALDEAARLTTTEIEAGLDKIVPACAECHSLHPGGQATNAPALWGVGERSVAGSDFTGYSGALRGVGGGWDADRLAEYLDDPQAFAPGTTMPDPFIEDPAVLEALANYLMRLR